jgi:hypothetical protein
LLEILKYFSFIIQISSSLKGSIDGD